MQRVATRIAIGLSIITASLVLAAPASATNQTRWMNANQTHGAPFFLGVSGGPVCNRVGCGLNDGTNIIVWQAGQSDQLWNSTAPGQDLVIDYYGNINTGAAMCLGVAGGSTNQGAGLIIWHCNGNPDQKWNLITAESLQAPFPGCFVFSDGESGQVMGVSGGNVQNGTRVIQWPLFVGVPNQPTGWHSDQFWCPQ
jgi:hypothetical protein